MNTEELWWKPRVVEVVRRSIRANDFSGYSDENVWESIWDDFVDSLDVIAEGTKLRYIKRHRNFDQGSINPNLEAKFLSYIESYCVGTSISEECLPEIEKAILWSRREKRRRPSRQEVSTPEEIGQREEFSPADIKALSCCRFDVFRYAFKGRGYCTREIVKIGHAEPGDTSIALHWYFRLSHEDSDYRDDDAIRPMVGRAIKFDGDLYFLCSYQLADKSWRRRRCLVLSEPTETSSDRRNDARWGVILSTAPSSSVRAGQPVWGKVCFVRNKRRLAKNEYKSWSVDDRRSLAISKNVTELIRALPAKTLPCSEEQIVKIFDVISEVVNKRELLEHAKRELIGYDSNVIETIFHFLADKIDPGLLWYDGKQDEQAGFASS